MNASICISLVCHLETKIQEANSSCLIWLPKYGDFFLNSQVKDIINEFSDFPGNSGIRICLPVQRDMVQSLVQVDPHAME